MFNISVKAKAALDVIEFHGFLRIAENIRSDWGTKEVMPYIKSLVENTDEDRFNREGFPFAVINALTDLMDEHVEQFPSIPDVRGGGDVWGKG